MRKKKKKKLCCRGSFVSKIGLNLCDFVLQNLRRSGMFCQRYISPHTLKSKFRDKISLDLCDFVLQNLRRSGTFCQRYISPHTLKSIFRDKIRFRFMSLCIAEAWKVRDLLPEIYRYILSKVYFETRSV
jgi:hypothetical protein